MLQLFGFLSGFCLSSQKLQRTLPLKVKKMLYVVHLNYRRFSLKNGLQKWKDLFGRVTCVKKLYFNSTKQNHENGIMSLVIALKP